MCRLLRVCVCASQFVHPSAHVSCLPSLNSICRVQLTLLALPFKTQICCSVLFFRLSVLFAYACRWIKSLFLVCNFIYLLSAGEMAQPYDLNVCVRRSRWLMRVVPVSTRPSFVLLLCVKDSSDQNQNSPLFFFRLPIHPPKGDEEKETKKAINTHKTHF